MDMNWNIIKTQEDVEFLNDLFGNFHDCCLKETCFTTGGFVSKNYAMNVLSTPVARFLLQRQIEKPAVIELEFSEVIQINIKPVDINQGVDIICTHLYLKNGLFFWSEKDYEYHEKNKDMSTWIVARAVKWRQRDDLLGEKLVYMVN